MEAGKHVILRDLRGVDYIKKVQRGRDERIGKYKFPLGLLIGQPYGSTFREEGGKWKGAAKITLGTIDDDGQGEGEGEEEDAAADDGDGDGDGDMEQPEPAVGGAGLQRTNQYLQDDNTAQALTQDDIHRMKQEGKSADELIAALKAHSSTFAGKTAFSQQKWLVKKQKKYVKQLTAMRPGILELCELYAQIDPAKICGLRVDYVGAIVTLGNVSSGRRVIVCDQSMGLITAAIAQQMAGDGVLYRVTRRGVSDKIVHELDTPTQHRQIVTDVPSEILTSASPWEEPWLKQTAATPHTATQQGTEAAAPPPPAAAAAAAGPEREEPDKDTTQAADAQTTEQGDKAASSRSRGRKRKAPPTSRPSDDDPGSTTPAPPASDVRRERRIAIFKRLENEGVQSVVGVLAGPPKGDPAAMSGEMMTLADRYLKPDGRFVLYCQYAQPLTSLQAALHRSPSFIHVRVEQLFLREWQVLPGRTHPLMASDMRLLGGFILSAIKVLDG
ncbi:unnamed protein product [Vitrella brassicaformis CCMP3155]|uniref:tRNA (adenine(58)-N(1))-methyltransferase non-catalytic subunit TRM6 n=2 Tax=Vitrella brassicaformis TaxID=1169539 RepID=A0A0G4EGX7_VITBC|nr:unnamed protein product [Vitrella brassicaformis CCMP3155]|eukprot:CEL95497.1 unnamed protein product [Vitrella brassicaformis CCMP3155]